MGQWEQDHTPSILAEYLEGFIIKTYSPDISRENHNHPGYAGPLDTIMMAPSIFLYLSYIAHVFISEQERLVRGPSMISIQPL